MIFLIDHVLPESYFANNLRALSVDMAVFRDLLRLTHPSLSKHLDHLQYAAQDKSTGICSLIVLSLRNNWSLTLLHADNLHCHLLILNPKYVIY